MGKISTLFPNWMIETKYIYLFFFLNFVGKKITVRDLYYKYSNYLNHLNLNSKLTQFSIIQHCNCICKNTTFPFQNKMQVVTCNIICK